MLRSLEKDDWRRSLPPRASRRRGSLSQQKAAPGRTLSRDGVARQAAAFSHPRGGSSERGSREVKVSRRLRPSVGKVSRARDGSARRAQLMGGRAWRPSGRLGAYAPAAARSRREKAFGEESK